MSSFKDIINVLIEVKGLTKSRFSESIGKGKSGLSGILSRGSTPGADIIAKILEVYPDVNPYWLLLNRGEMFVPEKDELIIVNKRLAKLESKMEHWDVLMGQLIKKGLLMAAEPEEPYTDKKE